MRGGCLLELTWQILQRLRSLGQAVPTCIYLPLVQLDLAFAHQCTSNHGQGVDGLGEVLCLLSNLKVLSFTARTTGEVGVSESQQD